MEEDKKKKKAKVSNGTPKRAEVTDEGEGDQGETNKRKVGGPNKAGRTANGSGKKRSAKKMASTYSDDTDMSEGGDAELIAMEKAKERGTKRRRQGGREV